MRARRAEVAPAKRTLQVCAAPSCSPGWAHHQVLLDEAQAQLGGGHLLAAVALPPARQHRGALAGRAAREEAAEPAAGGGRHSSKEVRPDMTSEAGSAPLATPATQPTNQPAPAHLVVSFRMPLAATTVPRAGQSPTDRGWLMRSAYRSKCLATQSRLSSMAGQTAASSSTPAPSRASSCGSSMARAAGSSGNTSAGGFRAHGGGPSGGKVSGAPLPCSTLQLATGVLLRKAPTHP